MATTLTAANATNGMKLTPDNTGILEIKTGTGSGTTALTLDASQNATFAGTVAVAGSTTALYPLVSSTSQAASGAAVNFTGIPSTAKRVTVMLANISTTSTGQLSVQIGSGSLSVTGYVAYVGQASSAGVNGAASTTGFQLTQGTTAAATVFAGIVTLTLLDSNIWTEAGNVGWGTGCSLSGGNITLGGALDRVSLLTSLGTFDAGTVNIMWE